MKENTAISRWLQRAGYVIFLFVIVEMVVLIQQNRNLKRQLNEIGSPHPIEFLKVNDQVASFDLKDINGHEMSVAFGSSKKQTLLFMFSTTCPHCERNLAKWKDISEKIKRKDKDAVNVMGVSISNNDETKEYYLKNKLNYTTLVADTSFERLYKVEAVPQTLLINGDGKVKNNWTGELTAQQVKELMSTIGS
jgi:peroxiredoxin